MDNNHTYADQKEIIKITIADDHQLVIDGLVALLEKELRYKIVGEALNGEELLRSVQQEPTDLVLLDIEMPKMDGLKTTAILKKHLPHIKILILTMHDSEGFVKSLFNAGVDGYLLKNTSHKDLVFAIDTIMNGRKYFPREVLDILIKEKPVKIATGIELTPREKQVICMICDGKKTRDIAIDFDKSENTIERHRNNIFRKLGVKNAAELVRYAMEHGLCK